MKIKFIQKNILLVHRMGLYSPVQKNEELFLAIAALKDDTDNNQLFTNGKGDWGIYRDGSDGGLSGMDFYGMPNDFEIDNYHKATVDELIEHFKTKEEHYDRRTCNIRNSEVAERERV